MANEASVVHGLLVDLASRQAAGGEGELSYDAIVAELKSSTIGKVKAGWFKDNRIYVQRIYREELARHRADPMISGSEGNSVRESSSSFCDSDRDDDSSSSSDSDNEIDLSAYETRPPQPLKPQTVEKKSAALLNTVLESVYAGIRTVRGEPLIEHIQTQQILKSIRDRVSGLLSTNEKSDTEDHAAIVGNISMYASNLRKHARRFKPTQQELRILATAASGPNVSL